MSQSSLERPSSTSNIPSKTNYNDDDDDYREDGDENEDEETIKDADNDTASASSSSSCLTRPRSESKNSRPSSASVKTSIRQPLQTFSHIRAVAARSSKTWSIRGLNNNDGYFNNTAISSDSGGGGGGGWGGVVNGQLFSRVMMNEKNRVLSSFVVRAENGIGGVKNVIDVDDDDDDVTGRRGVENKTGVNKNGGGSTAEIRDNVKKTPLGNGTTMTRTNGGLSTRASQRLVYKNGECNVSRANIKKRRQRYMADIFTTLVDIKWRWNLLNFVLAFTLSWLGFALIWWLVCFSHGDFNNRTENHTPCVEEVTDFTTALLFSIETQQTIGYGSRHTNPDCPTAILVMMFQSCFGVIIQALMTGLVFAKLSRPKKRAETLLFSKHAVVCKRDGQLCLLFRVGDMRKSHIVEAHVRAIMIKKRVTQEGEVVPLFQQDLKLGDGETEGRLFMVWPVIVEHRITEDSPFWELSAEDLAREKFELVVVLEGIVESTGMTTQARTSYLPEEILWGHRFEKLVTFQKDTSQYLIDYSKFHWTVGVDVPQCSAHELYETRRKSSASTEENDEEDDETASVRSDPMRFINMNHMNNRTGEIVQGGTEEEEGVGEARSGKRDPTTGARLANGIWSPPLIRRMRGISGAALAAFDLPNDDDAMVGGTGGQSTQTYRFF